MPNKNGVNRREFVTTAVGVSSAAGMASSAAAARPAAGRVLGSNDRINVGFIGVGGRGSSLLRLVLRMAEEREDIKVTAVCDVYEKRKRLAQERSGAEFSTLDYREVLARPDVDAVVVATPDHWHGQIALDALDRGKDVYLEKPMCHTIDEARKVAEKVKQTKGVLQVGSQTTSARQWWKARKAIADGMIGPLLTSQGSYHRNSVRGEWNYDMDPDAGPAGTGENYIDWKTWLGPAPKRDWDPQRFFRFRKYWDYSGGIATDLFYHVVAPLNICWDEPQFPYRVAATGGIYAFKDREVPDTFNLLADFAKGHSLVLSSSMANSTHIPGLLRGQHGTITMVDHGQFEGRTDHITVAAERAYLEEFVSKWGYQSVDIPVEQTPQDAHMSNFFECMRTRQKPVLDADTAYRAQVTISMSVESYRQGKVLYFDPIREQVVEKAPLLG
ncbi:MAG: Gfo/Idh/MocA family oxidoreductase [Acidobacteria bacterium]|nr:Gfo/Idh/MocA family oxidoreductase [Acidobacteriota bacterium]